VEGREGLWLSAEQRGSLMIVTIRGDLDIVSSGRFDDCLKQARAVSKRILLDLAGVDFMDTSALAVIVGHWKKLKAEDGTLMLAGARYRYTKSLWITGLADRLPLYDSVELAIAAEDPAAADPAAGEQQAGQRQTGGPLAGDPLAGGAAAQDPSAGGVAAEEAPAAD
jgi:anti-sigma B factor antagonist